LNLLAPLYRLADAVRYRRHGDLGQHGEDLAHRYLRARRFIVVARNWRPPQGGGEIDIIAWDGPSLVFVEVKTRAASQTAVSNTSAPERAINPEKMRALTRTARDYLRRTGLEESPVRFDVIAIAGSNIDHLRDAFPFAVAN